MEIKVCIGSACHLKGSYDVIRKFQEVIAKLHLDNRITLKGSFCLNHCTKAVSTQIDNEEIMSMSEMDVESLINRIVEDNKWNI